MNNVTPFRHEGDRSRAIDFDLYVHLLVLHFGFSRRDAEVEAWKECRRDGLMVVRASGAYGQTRTGESK